MIPWPVLLATGAAGLCLGSFAATAALRKARGEAFVAGRSRCDDCGVALGFAATLPVVGFALRRGACRHCGAAIDPTHLAGEVTGALLLTLPLVIAGPVRGGLIAALGLLLLAASVFDLKTQRLPDRLNLAAAVVSAALAWTWSPRALIEGSVAAVVSGLLLLILRAVYLRRRNVHGLGLGDVKLVAALALWLGAATSWAIALAAALGLAAFRLRKVKGVRMAFGPFIAAAAIVVGLIQEAAGWPLRL
ncbi:prepilin peptidase [Caulobacter sp. KR2-114]|uniref:prepilin peptidase n=1 Tax=Caulobacter sp. KR2-114 TaxID=3400912 RepID=UPI003C00DA74